MANEAQNTDGDGGHNVDGLLRKNAELLAEVRGLKTRITELEGERDAARGEAQEAEQTTKRLLIEEPLQRLLADAFVVPWRVVRPLLDEHFVTALSDNGAQVTAKASETTMPLAEGSQAILREIGTIPDLAALVRPPSGGGATGSGDARRASAPAKPAVVSAFGLR